MFGCFYVSFKGIITKISLKIVIFRVENAIFTIFDGFWGVFLGPALGTGVESASFYPK